MGANIRATESQAATGSSHVAGAYQGQAEAIDGPEHGAGHHAVRAGKARRHETPQEAPKSDHPHPVVVVPCMPTTKIASA